MFFIDKQTKNVSSSKERSPEYASRGNCSRGQGRYRYFSSNKNKIYYQICKKSGHSNADCYHHMNLNYQPQNQKLDFNSPTTLISISPEVIDPNWYLDTRANNHITPDFLALSLHSLYKGPGKVAVGLGQELQIKHTGSGTVNTPTHHFSLSNILHVSSLTTNLIYVNKFTKDNNYIVSFDAQWFFIQDKTTNRLIHQGSSRNGLYHLPKTKDATSFSSQPQALSTRKIIDSVWHNRLGHPSSLVLNSILTLVHVPLNSSTGKFDCNNCALAKCHRTHLPSSTTMSKCPLDIVHGDIWGPAPMISFSGFRFYLLLVDDTPGSLRFTC